MMKEKGQFKKKFVKNYEDEKETCDLIYKEKQVVKKSCKQNNKNSNNYDN